MSAPNTNPGEFLVELEDKDAMSVLHNCITTGADLMLKNETDPTPAAAKVGRFADKKVILETAHVDRIAAFKGQTSIKFFIGTEVYFIKTALESVDKQIAFDQTAKVVQLRRRKEPRYNVPEKWNQSTAVWSIELQQKNDAKVIDFSLGGCRYEVSNLTFDFKKGDQVRLQYQIFKRASVVCDAIIRFIMKKPNGTAILGLEFTQLNKGHKARIDNIVEDLINHHANKNTSVQ